MICNKEYDKKKCGGNLKRTKNAYALGEFAPIPLYLCDKCGNHIGICESGSYTESVTNIEAIPIKLHK